VTIPRGWTYHEKRIKFRAGGGGTIERVWKKRRGSHASFRVLTWDALHQTDPNLAVQLHQGVRRDEVEFVCVLLRFLAEQGRLPSQGEVEAMPQLEAQP